MSSWTVDHQAPLSVGFPRQEYWSGLLLSSPGDLLTQELNLRLLHWRQISFFFYHWAAWASPVGLCLLPNLRGFQLLFLWSVFLFLPSLLIPGFSLLRTQAFWWRDTFSLCAVCEDTPERFLTMWGWSPEEGLSLLKKIYECSWEWPNHRLTSCVQITQELKHRCTHITHVHGRVHMWLC